MQLFIESQLSNLDCLRRLAHCPHMQTKQRFSSCKPQKHAPWLPGELLAPLPWPGPSRSLAAFCCLGATDGARLHCSCCPHLKKGNLEQRRPVNQARFMANTVSLVPHQRCVASISRRVSQHSSFSSVLLTSSSHETQNLPRAQDRGQV